MKPVRETDPRIKMVDQLIGRLSALEYQDHDALIHIGTDTRLFIRRVFGQESVWMHDMDQIRFTPKGFIADSQNMYMTGLEGRSSSS